MHTYIYTYIYTHISLIAKSYLFQFVSNCSTCTYCITDKTRIATY